MMEQKHRPYCPQILLEYHPTVWWLASSSWISPRSFLTIDGLGSGQRRRQAASSMRFFFRPKRCRTKGNCIFHSRTHPFHNFFDSWTQLAILRNIFPGLHQTVGNVCLWVAAPTNWIEMLEEQIETNALDNAIVNVIKLRLFTIVSNEGMRQCSWLDEATGGVRVGWTDTFEKLRKPLCF